MKSTNYRDTLILVASDCRASEGTSAKTPGSIAALQLELLLAAPYTLTSDDLLFEVYAIRNGIAKAARAEAKAMLFARPQACLRASPLIKQFGWGLHHDAQQRVAAVAMESKRYGNLAADPGIVKVPGMRSRRA